MDSEKLIWQKKKTQEASPLRFATVEMTPCTQRRRPLDPFLPLDRRTYLQESQVTSCHSRKHLHSATSVCCHVAANTFCLVASCSLSRCFSVSRQVDADAASLVPDGGRGLFVSLGSVVRTFLFLPSGSQRTQTSVSQLAGFCAERYLFVLKSDHLSFVFSSVPV